MLKKVAVILFAVLTAFNHAGGISAVLCIGSNGRIAVEPSFQNGCTCPDSEPSGAAERALFAGSESCRDIPLMIAAIHKVVRTIHGDSMDVLSAKPLTLPPLAVHSIAEPTFTPSYFTPLQTIILTV